MNVIVNGQTDFVHVGGVLLLVLSSRDWWAREKHGSVLEVSKADHVIVRKVIVEKHGDAPADSLARLRHCRRAIPRASPRGHTRSARVRRRRNCYRRLARPGRARGRRLQRGPKAHPGLARQKHAARHRLPVRK